MPSRNSESAKTNRPVCFNFEVPCEDCIQPVTFVDIPKFYITGESIVLNYTILKSFNPKSEDWLGLFKCCRHLDKCFEFVGFKWAQKKPTFKYRPLARTVVFHPEDIEVETSDDKYLFLYLTTNERIIGQSSLFDFRKYSPTPKDVIEFLKPQNLVDEEMDDVERVENEEEKQETASAENSDEESDKFKTLVHITKPELPAKSWMKNKEFYKIQQKHQITNVKKSEKSKIEFAETDEKEAVKDEHTKKVYTIKEESVAEIDEDSVQSSVQHVPDMIRIFEKLIHQESALVDRVNRIEKKNEEFVNAQVTIQEQIFQYMKNIEKLTKPENQVSKTQQTDYVKPRRKLPKIITDALAPPKNLRYYFPKDSVKKTFSGSEMAFKYLFNDLKQDKLKVHISDEMIEEEEAPLIESNKTTEVRKVATDISDLLKKLMKDVDNSASKKIGTSLSLQNNIKKEGRTINFDDFNRLLKKKKSLQMSVQPKNQNTYSGSNIAIDLLFDQNSGPSDVVQTDNIVQSTNAQEKKTCSLKVTLSNQQDLNQSVLEMTLNDFLFGICDNEPVLLDICKNDEPRKSKKVKTINTELNGTGGENNNLETILTTTSDVVEQFKNRSLKEKLLTSSSYPTGKQQLSAACQRLQQLKDKMFSTKTSYKTCLEDEKISNASMAVQIGSAEETSAAVLSSTPAVTRLTLMDSYEILSPSRQEDFDYNRGVKQDHTTKLLLIRDILQSDVTDEEKILNIEQLTSMSSAKTNRLKKQYQYRFWNKKNKKMFGRNVKTEHETSDTSGESSKTEESAVSFPDRIIKNEFSGRKKSKKLKRNKFGRNKFTQTIEATTTKAESQTSESSLDDNLNFPKLVRKPLPSSIIPVLLSDSKNSIHASSEEDFKAKPILKKKASPLPQPTKECGQNARKTSVTFLVDASIQCEASDFDKINEDTDNSSLKTLIDKRVVDVKSNHSDTTSQEEDQVGHKRERKVSFNTIILTSLFDNEENEKEDQNGNIKTIKPNGKSTWPNKEPHDVNTTKIPPVHQFLDFIEKEVKNVSENTAVLQNSLNKAMRIFKAEAVMLKDKSAEVLTKAIRAISPQRTIVERKPSPAKIEIKLTSVAPVTNAKTRISRSRSNEPRLTNKSSPKDMIKLSPPASENFTETEKKKTLNLQVIEKNDLVKNQLVKTDKDLDYLRKEIELQMFLQNFLRQVQTLTDNDSSSVQASDDSKPAEKSPTESVSPTFKKSAEDIKVSDDEAHHIRKTISDSSKVPQYFWEYKINKRKESSKNESNTSLVNNPETPVVSLYSQSDCYKSSYTVGTQSLINSFSPQSSRPERQRISGLMLLQSFDSTISNIVKLYNNFTSYAFSSLTSSNFTFLQPTNPNQLQRTDADNNTFVDPDSFPPYTGPNPSRSESNESEASGEQEINYEHKSNFDLEYVVDKIENTTSLPMSFSHSNEETKEMTSPKHESIELDIISSLFKTDDEKTNVDPVLDASVQDNVEEFKEESKEMDVEVTPQHHPTIIVDEKEKNDIIIEELNRDLIATAKEIVEATKSVEFCLTCSDEFPLLKNAIESPKSKRSNSVTSGKSKKKKKD
ncbi:hypothetical protein HELRODRAFT_169673 [Helobdella robusta]|uniref:SKICH domain-containing protein n=1 Tax=Helobdella robusta TaxID=6412 RepID=T1F278_HELRO|nr:hypothetical protein HELRODRAFT_169673 [Helobdella robusta]ESO07959.1 hypothetical protein HELRODRAFT_169673 [Helobdella robusta]